MPTCNLYGPDSKEILEWGYPAKLAMTKPPYKNHVLLSKYKLHLDESSGPHAPLPNGLTVVEAIADYLRLFHAHVVQVIALRSCVSLSFAVVLYEVYKGRKGARD